MPQKGWTCVATGEIVSYAHCLLCSLQSNINRPNGGCEFTYEILAGIRSNLFSSRPESLSVSRLISPTRKAYLTATQDFYVSPRRNFWAFRGTLFHKIAQDAGRRSMSWYEVPLPREIEIKGKTYQVRGRADIIRPQAGYIEDFKSCKRVPKANTAYGNHSLQLNIYRWLFLPIMDLQNLRVIYFDMNETKRVSVELMPLEEVEAFIMEKAAAYIKAIETKTIPEGSYNSKKWKCKYCDVVDICKKL